METTQPADALARTLARTTPRTDPYDRLDPRTLSRAGLIDALTATERLIAHAQALHLSVLAALDATRTENPLDCTADEITAALRWSPTATRNRLHLAASLADRFPETLALLAEGRTTRAHAHAMVDLTSALEREPARAVQARVLPRLPHQSVATARKALSRAVLAADPHTAHARHVQEVKRRRVVLYPEPDGMATLALYATAHTGTALLAALDRHAAHRAPGDTRTLDQRRADTLAHLVLTGAGVRSTETQTSDTSPPAPVHVTVGIDTLLGTSEEPAELRGYGPITPQQARALAYTKDATWRRLLTAPDGALLHTDPRTYRPTASTARLVRLRDRTCTFPGCSMPAKRCDLDHIEPFNHQQPKTGGRTTLENLQALCRRHHRLKTAGTWQVTRQPDGSTVWTSATTRRTYTTQATGYAAAA